jgi:hypothetical protein
VFASRPISLLVSKRASVFLIIVLSHAWVGAWHKMGFGLDDWIYYILYIHNSGLQVIQCYCCSTHFPVHCYTHTHTLGFSVFTSCLLETDLSVCNFKSHMKSSLHHLILFLALIPQLPIPKTRLHSTPLLPSSYAGRLESRPFTSNSTTVLFSTWSHFLTVPFYNPLAWTTQKTQPLLLGRCVYRSVT